MKRPDLAPDESRKISSNLTQFSAVSMTNRCFWSHFKW